MAPSRTITTTTTTASPRAGPSTSRPIPPSPSDPADFKDDEQEDNVDEIMRRAREKVWRVKEKRAAEAAKRKAEEEAARKAAEEARWQKEAAVRELVKRRQRLAEAATARSWRGTSPREVSESPHRPIVEVRRIKGKGKERVREEAAGGDPDNGGEGQVKANTYHRHFNKKLDWLMIDAPRRRKSPPKMPEAGPSQLPKKWRRVVDSEEKEEEKIVEGEKDGEGEEEVEEEEGEEDKPAPKKAQSEKEKEREDVE
ncbi:hypothetical protein EV359DRAFT_85467 [Lentinula novae-zelandiae]|nr:hypothetical protein EV359DRAFT_85467 [Lentinula novae-zelandiae]